MQTQRNIMIGLVAVLSLILVSVICNHKEKMRVLDIEMEKVKVNKVESIKKTSGAW